MHWKAGDQFLRLSKRKRNENVSYLDICMRCLSDSVVEATKKYCQKTQKRRSIFLNFCWHTISLFRVSLSLLLSNRKSFLCFYCPWKVVLSTSHSLHVAPQSFFHFSYLTGRLALTEACRASLCLALAHTAGYFICVKTEKISLDSWRLIKIVARYLVCSGSHLLKI